MYDPHFPQPNQRNHPRTGGDVQHRRHVIRLALGATLLGATMVPTVAEAAPSSARQIERRALDARDAGDVVPVPVRGPEVLSIDCAAPAAVAGQRVHIGCTWTLPTTAPARQLTLWRSVDGAVREQVATFGWPFENSYRDVVPAETQHVAYAIIGTDGSGELVARSRADRLRLPTSPNPVRPDPTVPPATAPPGTVPPVTVPPVTVPPVTVSTAVEEQSVRSVPTTPEPTVVTATATAAAATESTVRTVPTTPPAAPASPVDAPRRQRGDGG